MSDKRLYVGDAFVRNSRNAEKNSDSPVARFVERLGEIGIEVHGRKARCPAHDDHEPSLAIATGVDGRLLLHCHAGCATDEVLAAVGWRWHDLFPPSTRRVDTRDVPTRDVDALVRRHVLSSTDVSCSRGPRPNPEELLERYASGDLRPATVLAPVPSGLGRDATRVANFLWLIFGLCAAVGEFRPMPCSTRWVAQKVEWLRDGRPDHIRASRALRALEKAAYVVNVGSLEPRSQRFGTKLYAPGVPTDPGPQFADDEPAAWSDVVRTEREAQELLDEHVAALQDGAHGIRDVR